MDPLIVVAIISGGYTVIGAILKIVDKYFPGKTPPALPSPTADSDRESRIDAKIEKHLERIESDAEAERTRHRAEVDEMRSECDRKMDVLRIDHERLQDMYREALERLESQGVALKHREPGA